MSNTNLESLSQKLKSGSLVLFDYIAEILQHIEITEPIIHALIPEPGRKQRLFQAAEVLLTKYPDPATRPPLFGVLIGIKDLFNVDGLPTQAGSKLPPAAFAGKEAEVVTQLKNLGAIILGKTVSTEFAYFSPGPTCNPINPSHTPGGSSSGSAVAVASGYCPFALGTQTIASIIRPAAYCGVYGFKPSWGRISAQGVFPFSQTADHVGIISSGLEELSIIIPLIVKDWKADLQQGKPTLGIVRNSYLAQVNEQVRANYEASLMELKSKGFKLVECDLFGEIEKVNTVHRRLIAAEFAQNHQALFAEYSHLYSPQSKELISLGLEVSDTELISLKKACLSLRNDISRCMATDNIDLWITPSTTSTAPLGLTSTGSPLMSLPWTNAGLPSITYPNGTDEQGMPFGLQLIAGFGRDEYLLSACRSM